MDIYCTVRLKVYATRQNDGRVSLQRTKKNMYMKLFICHLPACENTYANTSRHTLAYITRRAKKLQIDVSKCGTKNGTKNFWVSFLCLSSMNVLVDIPPRHCSNSCILLRIILQRHSNSNNINKNFKVFALGHVPAADSWIFFIFVRAGESDRRVRVRANVESLTIQKIACKMNNKQRQTFA